MRLSPRHPRRHLVSAVVLALGLSFAAGAPADGVVIDRIVAVVNGEVITLLDLYRAELPMFGRVILPGEYGVMEPADRARELDLLNRLVEERLLLQEARARGLALASFDVDEAVESIMKEQKMDREMLGRALEQRGISMDEYRERIGNQILISKLVTNEIRLKIIVSPEDISAYYQEHRAEYSTPERVKIRHMLVLKPSGEAASEARARAERLASLLQGGEDFREVAQLYSEDSSRQRGEVSGFIQRGDVLPELERIVFDLEEGEISPLVETEMGFHIVKMEAKEPASTRSLAEVTPEIRTVITEARIAERYRDWLDQLGKDAAIDIRL